MPRKRKRELPRNIEQVGDRFRFHKTVKYVQYHSPAWYETPEEAQTALFAWLKEFQDTGRPPKILEPSSEHRETVAELYRRWVHWLGSPTITNDGQIRWVDNHRSGRHARDMENLMTRALAQAPEYASLPADDLTTDMTEDWASSWASDLVDRSKGRGEVNKWLKYSQTAWSEPWGKKRAIPFRQQNPFKYVERFAVFKKVKYVPRPLEVNSIRMAADGEYRLYLELMIETAARPSEARNIPWEDVRCFDPPFSVVLYTRKTATGSHKSRRLEISRALANRFRSWSRTQGDGKLYVFEQEDAQSPRVAMWEVKNQRRCCAAGKLEYFPPGCFRHYTASRWAAEGLPFTTIQGRLGHTQATTTNNYLHEIGKA